MASKRKRLNLKEKINVLEVAEKEKLSVHSLVERFHVGKTQISELLKNKEGIRKMWVLNSNENLKNFKFLKTETSEIDEVLMKWFRSARAKNIPICGEEKSVNPNEVTDWIGKLKSLLKGYDDRDIFNADETGLFYRVLPDKTLCFKDEKCSSGKISKERLTILLCCNMLGDFETPVVIGKAKKPRCFKNIDVRKLSVSWKSNKKAWMTTEIMRDWIVELDNKMKKQKRKIILFMDNATSHPDDLKLKNINLVFLPPNTTSMLQPLDQGIIHSFKKAGFLSTSKVTTVSTTEKREKELADLVANLDSNVSVEEYVKIDNDLSIEEEKMHVSNCIHRDTTEALALSEDDDEESPIEDCKIKDYSEALKYSEQLRQFFLNNEDSEGLAKVNPMKIHLEKQVCCVKQRKQTLLTDFFK
ncbi:Tigger transposable element-derived protein 4 [Araneus ventricosus]|uniref:Tigger transposable element-derived protein 4 n=1 Tax=Araneus ventricosus TaxID=182803 RepID=A0A4Y2VEB2_ARAVE|nr:Tigger transposable element-derived protein 4 [Araneus ventricosus]